MDQKKIKSSRPYHHCHQNKKDRVEKRNAYEKEEAKQSLESLLIFKRACYEDSCLKDSRAKDFFPKDKGITIARTLSAFLRHGMNEGQFCQVHGSVEIEELARSICILLLKSCFQMVKSQ